MGKVAEAFALDAAGNAVALQPHQVAAAGDAGFTGITAERAAESAKARADSDYVDQHWGTAGKAAAGALGGLTLGLGPAALVSSGMMDRAHLEAAQESGAYTAGDIAGMIAPAVLSGGESLLGRGLAQGGARGLGRVAAALTPAGLMGEAGGAAERLAARFLPEAGILGKAANTTVSMAARGATEGAMMNLSHQVSQDVIQNKPLTAAALLASGADGALFGGLAGGILGGAGAAAGAGIDVVGGRLAGLGVGTGESAAAKYLKHFGATDAQVASIASKGEGQLIRFTRDFHDVLDNGSAGAASSAESVSKAVKAAREGYEKTAKSVVEELDGSLRSALPNLGRVQERIKTDVSAMFSGTSAEAGAMSRAESMADSLSGVKTWSGWTRSREMLADKVESTVQPMRKQVLKTALNAMDDEIATAMSAANPELATQWGAAVTGQRNASAMAEIVAGRGAPAGFSNPLTSGIGYITAMHPAAGATMMAGKLAAHAIGQHLEAPIAEMAYRGAIGGHASGAVVDLTRHVSGTLKAFVTGARQVAGEAHAEARGSKVEYTVKSLNQAMKLTDELTSAAHQAKVTEMAAAVAQAGHPEVATEMAEAYGRAVAYLNNSKKALAGRSPEYAIGSLTKTAKRAGLSTAESKYLQQVKVIQKPLSVLDRIKDGSVSRVQMATLSYVLPALADKIVSATMETLLEHRQAGKFIDANKLAILGVVMNAPVDSKLTKEFIDECQKGLAANNAPPKKQGPSGPPPITDISQFQTPLQSA